MAACSGGGDDNEGTPSAPVIQAPPPRTWKLGFSPTPPRPFGNLVLQGIDLWALRAELVIIHEELPWAKLLNGQSPDLIIASEKANLLAYLRGKGLELVYMGDPTDPLSRSQEAPQLRVRGRSITEPEIQRLYREYMLAVARLMNPQIVGVAAETNLIRAVAPERVYDAVVQVGNDTASELRAAGASMPLMTSVQVETAWGVLGEQGPYVGIDADLHDFPFIDVLGLSSSPYLGYADPDEIPNDYYRRLVPRHLPAMVTEGGWPSASVSSIQSTPDEQARYIERHAALLDSISARAWLHLLFADTDLVALRQPIPANLPLFATNGFTDSDFNPKPALAKWDALFARQLAR